MATPSAMVNGIIPSNDDGPIPRAALPDFDSAFGIFTSKYHQPTCAEFTTSSLLQQGAESGSVASSVSSSPPSSFTARANVGQVLTVLGPAKCGKTTLLNALVGRQAQISLTLKINGRETTPQAFHKRTAYIVRKDLPCLYCTPREAMEFSSRLRLPSGFSQLERQELVANLVESLGFAGNNKLFETLSPYEKKLFLLGVELASLPRLLLLDQTLADLDVRASHGVFALCKLYASASGSAVVLTSQGLTSEVFGQLERILVLSLSGQCLYQGLAKDVDSFFCTEQRPMLPLRTNPSEFVFAVIDEIGHSGADQMSLSYADNATKTNNQGANSIPGQDEVFEARMTRPRPGKLVQFMALLTRDLRAAFFRDKKRVILRVMPLIFMGCFIDLVFQNQGNQYRPNYDAGSHFASIALTMTVSTAISLTFAIMIAREDLPVFMRETTVSTTYGPLPHLLSKVVVELPINFGAASVFVLVMHWAVGWGANPIQIIFPFFLLFEASFGVACLLVHVLGRASGASVGPILVFPQLFFLGLLIPIGNMASWLQWVEYACYVKYGVNIAASAEFSSDLCANKTICQQWAHFFVAADINSASDSLYIWVLVLGFIVGTRLLGQVALVVRMRRAKRSGHVD